VSEHLHDIDKVFKSAYQQFSEEPNAEVWRRINAALDKKEAASYKKRSVKWKRVSIILILLLTGFIIYEALIIRTNTRDRKKSSPEVTNIESRNSKATSSELRDINNDQRTNIDVDRKQAAHKKLLMEKVLMENVELNKTTENYTTLFSQHTGSVSLTEQLSTHHSDTALFKKALATTPPFIDYLSQSKNSSTSKIQPAGKNSWITWTYTPFVSYEWAQYRIDSDLPAVNSIKQGNEHEPSFSTGVLLTGQFAERWMFQSGIVYSNTTIDIAPQKIYAVQSPVGDYAYKYITSAGYGYIRPAFAATPALGDSLIATEAEHTLRHITVPLAIKYKIKKGKFSIMPGAGIAANFLTGTKVETELKNATDKEAVIITKLTGAKNFNWSITADAEMQYQLNNKMSLNLRPAFRYAISSITRNDDFQTFPYAFGIGVGMTFKF